MAEITITANNFDEEVLESKIPVLVDFWASWCGPCMMLSPIVEEIAKEFDGKIKVGKVNVDEEALTATEFNIVSIPTLILFKDGEIKEKMIGFSSKEEICKMIEGVL